MDMLRVQRDLNKVPYAMLKVSRDMVNIFQNMLKGSQDIVYMDMLHHFTQGMIQVPFDVLNVSLDKCFQNMVNVL
jgi:hypothetical protein